MPKLTINTLLDTPETHKARRTRSGRPKKGKKQLNGGSKVGDWFVKAGKYIKDKKLVSKGLKAVSPFLGAYGGVANGAAVIADMAGYGLVGNGLTIPGGCKCMSTPPRHHIQPHTNVRLQKGTGLTMGGTGLTLAGARYQQMQPMQRPRSGEVVGTGVMVGNRLF